VLALDWTQQQTSWSVSLSVGDNTVCNKHLPSRAAKEGKLNITCKSQRIKPLLSNSSKQITKLNSMAWVREWTILTKSDCHLLATLVPTFADRGCHVVSVTDSYGRNLSFLDRSRHFFFQIAPHLYSWGWVDPVPDPLLLSKSGCARNRTQTSRSVFRNSDH
jgi:hypothetical protein